jgi:hypothetical protein
MTAFTSVKTGNWNDGATWGRTSPGTKGTDWPGSAGDTFTIAAGHTVAYNVNETNELGAATINGLLIFATNMTTRLRFNHNNLTVASGGELRIGAAGAAIGSAYTANLEWNTTADNAKGLSISDGGKLTVNGDPAFYGSQEATTLNGNWTSGSSFNTGDDMSAKWKAGQVILINKNYAPASTSACYTDTFPATIQSISGTTVTINESFPGGTFYAGGVVVNVSRNVKIGKVIADAEPLIINDSGAWKAYTNRPTFTDNNTANANVTIADAMLTAFYRLMNLSLATLQNVVVRYHFQGFSNAKGVTANGGIIYCSSTAALNCMVTTFGQLVIACNSGPQNNNRLTFSGDVVGCLYGSNSNNSCDVTYAGNFVNNYYCLNGASNGLKYTGYLYNNRFVHNPGSISYPQSDIVFEGATIGFDRDGNAKANTYDFTYSGAPDIYWNNARLPASPVEYQKNIDYYYGRHRFDAYNQTPGDYRILDCFGTARNITCDGSGSPAVPNPRDASYDQAIQVDTLSNCNVHNQMRIINPNKHQVYCGAGITKKIRYYIQSTVALTNAEISLTAAYLDGTTLSSRTTVTSIQAISARADADDWTHYLEVEVTPVYDGYVYCALSLMKQVDAGSGSYVWVWPIPIEVCESPIFYGIIWREGETQIYRKDAVDANLIAQTVWAMQLPGMFVDGSAGEKVGNLKSAYAWKRTS